MAGGSKPAARGRKRVEAAVLKRSRDGSAFTRCEACNKDVPVVLIDMHSCSLDSKIRMTLEAQVVEKTVEVNKTERKRPAASAASKATKRAKEDLPKRKRSPTAFFLFMEDFRKEYKVAHPNNKSVATVAKEGGEKWRSMTDEEKKPYTDKAAELKAHADNGEGSGENIVAEEKGEATDDEGQEVDQHANGDEGQEEDEEKNELDDDI
ncbi:hypothetical protein PR202_gb29103 [Eleusine coracana subsp. coracana]|uniref:HMG box domain-containing protein n=1 Tax=Eleusine coracana subsp. coracana TaxID=191504 RepID=A0AAV5FYQ1_ELECO|nr:hypothetical protein QOZ80_8BG0641650 [Eleusine coracana subsp. coracana]GJN39949.1 hypothetical protein PR202_gb29103 [Eleusine coracana subsp. coracana]